MNLDRNPFKLFVTIDSSLTDVEDFLKQHKGYPIDNVIQIKLSKTYFTTLFKGDMLISSSFGNTGVRYNSEGLLSRLENFFTSEKYNNYNNFASDITTLILNTYNDIDINPVKLEKACKKNGDIFNYFFLSNTKINYENQNNIQYMYDDTSSQVGNIKVYQLIAREIDNMISRNINTDNLSQQSTSFEYQYSDLDQLYTVYNDEFWNNLQVGDSIFIEGSFKVPTSQQIKTYKNQKNENYNIIGTGNIPIIVQFVYSNNTNYGYQIAPIIVLTGNYNYTWDTFLSGIYIDPRATATDFTDVQVNITDQISVTVKKDNTILANNIPLDDIDTVFPQVNSQFSEIGNYVITYKITDDDGFTDSVNRLLEIIYTGDIIINNDYIDINSYYKNYSSNLNDLNIEHIFYEDPNNYNSSYIVVPFNANGYPLLPNFTVNTDNTGHVNVVDDYSDNLTTTFTPSLLPRTSIGTNTSQFKRQTFSIINNDTNITNSNNHLNFSTVNLNLDKLENINYTIQAQNNNVIFLNPDDSSFNLIKEYGGTFNVTSGNKFIITPGTDIFELKDPSNNSSLVTASNILDFQNNVNTWLNDNNPSTPYQYEFYYTITRIFQDNNGNSFQITVTDNKSLNII